MPPIPEHIKKAKRKQGKNIASFMSGLTGILRKRQKDMI